MPAQSWAVDSSKLVNVARPGSDMAPLLRMASVTSPSERILPHLKVTCRRL
jgi:hypothetical protein